MSKTHGTRYAYTTGCRCNKCRSANTTYMAYYRRDKPEPTSRRNKRRWEPWEDELASDYSKSAWQIADMIERTPAAVAGRRSALKAHRINKKEE